MTDCVCSAEIFDPDFEITIHVLLVNMKSADSMKLPWKYQREEAA